MRQADDLSDDESISREQRRINLANWLERWHSASRGEATSDPVFIALLDTQQCFKITSELLDQLVEGTAMDLDPSLDAPPGLSQEQFVYETYPTFEDLYRYCYYVASVVGLVCIRIFGYSDMRAEKLAEETGIAFQLTNILRDVREDAERGRVYLPVEDLDREAVTVDELMSIKSGAHLTLNQQELLAVEARRAEHYYQSGVALLPLIEKDSRPALWVLITIYHDLLKRIVKKNYDVFSTRVSVPTSVKLWILLRGLLQVLGNRLRGRS